MLVYGKQVGQKRGAYGMINKISKKSGISSIIGTLLMVAVVATVGSVILFQSLNGINDFNYYLSFLTSSNHPNESLVIEHVTFYPTNSTMNIWVRNVGSSQVQISKLSMSSMNQQTLLLDKNPQTTVSINQLVNLKQTTVPPVAQWQNSPYNTDQYKISITTTAGNSFETIARPFNT